MHLEAIVIRRLVIPVLFVSVLSLTTPASAQIVNPGNGHTYFATDVNMSMDLARIQAATVGGYVTAINDAAEESWIDDNFPGFHWIGLSDEVDEGVFLWDSGEPFNYDNWGNGQPDDLGGADYVERIGSGWFDQGPLFSCAIVETELPLGPSVENLSCEPVGTSVQLSWANPVVFSAIEVYRETELIATLPGDATEFFDDPPPGSYYYVYWLLPTGGADASRPVTCRTPAANGDFLLTVENAVIADNDPGTVRVLMTNLLQLAGWSYGICHDTDVLTILDVIPGSAVNALNEWLLSKRRNDDARYEASDHFRLSLRANPSQPRVVQVMLNYQL